VNRVRRSVTLARNHPNYAAYYDGYDISVLTLSEAVPYNDYIRPVCLGGPRDLLTSSLICYSTGWGLVNYNDSQYLASFSHGSAVVLNCCKAHAKINRRI